MHHIGQGNSRLFNDSLVAFDRTSSTAELLFHFFKAAEFPIDHSIALCLATGIVCDTGNFGFMTSIRTLRVKNDLRRHLHVTFSEIFDDVHMISSDEFRLYQHLRDHLLIDGTIGYFILDHTILERFTGRRFLSQTAFSVISNFIGHSTKEIDVLAFLCEISPNTFKGGLRKYPIRSGRKLDQLVDLRIVAAHYQGGGHAGAVGFTLKITQGEDPRDKIKEIVEMTKSLQIN